MPLIDANQLNSQALQSYSKGDIIGAKSLFERAASMGHQGAKVALARIVPEIQAYTPQGVKSPALIDLIQQRQAQGIK